MSERVTYDAAMRTLPSVLRNSESMKPLGHTTAKALQNAQGDTHLACIYARIEELPEELLDILAVDFGVDWYDYDYNLETKRNVIKESFYVHQHLGTVGAVKRALSAVWPPTSVEEWYEYGGDPYYFKVLLEASDVEEPIYINDIINIIRTYQSIRSHLENELPIIRVTFGIEIQTKGYSHKYGVDAAGTKPRWSTHGKKSYEPIVVETDGLSAPYNVPASGELVTGTYPRVQTHGNMDNSGLYVGTDTLETTYRARPCGTSLNSLM